MTTDWTWPNSTVLGVIDGDTLDVSTTLDIGFGRGRIVQDVRLRLNRINAPKGSTVNGKAATLALSSILAGAVGSGTTLTVVTVSPYKYGGPAWSPGEWMAEIPIIHDTGQPTTVSDLMVAQGHAVYWDGQGPRPDDQIERWLAGLR